PYTPLFRSRRDATAVPMDRPALRVLRHRDEASVRKVLHLKLRPECWSLSGLVLRDLPRTRCTFVCGHGIRGVLCAVDHELGTAPVRRQERDVAPIGTDGRYRRIDPASDLLSIDEHDRGLWFRVGGARRRP